MVNTLPTLKEFTVLRDKQINKLMYLECPKRQEPYTLTVPKEEAIKCPGILPEIFIRSVFDGIHVFAF